MFLVWLHVLLCFACFLCFTLLALLCFALLALLCFALLSCFGFLGYMRGLWFVLLALVRHELAGLGLAWEASPHARS